MWTVGVGGAVADDVGGDQAGRDGDGRHGGQDGAPGELWLASGAALPAKGEKEIPAGDRLIIKTPGGGGYGDPARRDPTLREDDRRDGLITDGPSMRC